MIKFPWQKTPCISFPLLVVVQLLSHIQLFDTPWTMACQASLPFTISQSLLKLMFIESMMSSNHLIQWRHLLLPPLIFYQHQGLFQWVSCSYQVAKVWSFSFNISPSNEYSGLISFMIDWFDLLAVQGTLKSLIQHHSSKASILWCSAFIMVQLSHQYMTTGKIIALNSQSYGSLLPKWCLCFLICCLGFS